MITELGKFLRKLRIDEGEILMDMAGKLGVTASFLSAVENGKKRMPSTWNTKICEIYSLSEEKKEEFTKAIAESEKTLELSFENSSMARRELAVSFARRFPELDEDQTKQIIEILRGGSRKR